MKKRIKAKKNAVNLEKERCVVCGVDTLYNFSTPINERQYYIEGVGQLCQKCHYDLYGKKNG